MDKPHHPCYTNVNPAAEAQRYTSETVYCRKVTLMYDWLPPDREVKNWFRRVPYRLERGKAEGSWVVKYFEFRAGIRPLPGVGFVGDLWISWDSRDPSIWFKVEERNWEKWGGCASSVREQMNATHPFLDKAYLWFSPGTFFFADKLPDTRLSLRWERSSRIRRIAPISRIIDPDSSVPPKKVPVSPLYLPSMRTIVRALCPNKLQLAGPVPPPPAPSVGPVLQFDHEEAGGGGGGGGDDVVASTSGVRVEDLREKFPMEEIILGDDVEIDWDWWGSTDGEAEDEATVVGSTQPQPSSFTPAPPPITPSRYHPYRLTSPPKTPFREFESVATPFKKFKPPARYAKGTLNQNISPSVPRDTPVSSFVSTSSTVVNPTTPTPPSTSKPTVSVFVDENEKVGDTQGQGVMPQDVPAYAQRPSQRTLEGIVKILREDGHNQSGVWALLPPEIYDAGGDLAAELPIPVLDLESQTLQKIKRLLLQDGFTQNGILILNIHDPSDHEQWDINGQMVKKKDILARI